MNQTLALTTLGGLGVGGHVVQGHVDGTGEVRAVGEDGLARRLLIAPPPELGRFIVERGSVTVDGVSLTVAALAEEGFEVSLVPETLERSTLGGLAEGSRVNLEV